MNIAALKCKTLVRQFHHIVDAIGNEAGISYVVNAKLKEENPLLLQRQSHFPSENKEENPLLLQRQSHFAPQNKEDWDEEVRDYYQT